MTYRERRERRAERLRGWAGSAEDKSKEAFDTAHQISDGIPMGQPILVGHHSEGRHRRDIARIDNNMRKGVENDRKAERHNEKADNIESQLERSIYSDDPDAIEQLEARIADLEAERSRIKAYNASCRKGKPDLSLLDKKQQIEIQQVIKVWGDSQCKGGVFPSYHLSNLSANINRNKKRLASLKRDGADTPRLIRARFASDCECGARIEKGETILYYPKSKRVLCPTCTALAKGSRDEIMHDEFYGGPLDA